MNKAKHGLKVMVAAILLNCISEVAFNWDSHVQAFQKGVESAKAAEVQKAN